MFTLYTSLKFLHVLTASVWIGGFVTLVVYDAMLFRSRDVDAVRLMTAYGGKLGPRLIGSAAGLTLLTGIAAMAVSGIGFALWALWGILVMIAMMVIGATQLGPISGKLSVRLATEGLDDPEVLRLRGRLQRVHGIEALLLLSAVAAMVFKPVV